MFKRTTITLLVISLILAAGCNKEDQLPAETTTEKQVLEDFANVLAIPNYLDIETKAAALNTSVETLVATTTDANLTLAQDAWRAVREPWEKCEGYLFGPVEDFNYDPTMDDWPLNKVDMDSLLASSNSLSLDAVDALPTSLKGFHAIEYMLFGVGGTKTASQFTDRQKLYLSSLTQSLYNTTVQLHDSWDPEISGNFSDELINAGEGSSYFSTRKDAFIAIVTAMVGICEEVGEGKMEEPLLAQDSTLEESQFSHNSTADFTHNMMGVLNAYLGNYEADGHGLNELVAAKNLSLDQQLQTQMNAVVNSFSAINANYGEAIYTQQVQIKNTQDAISTLKTMLENDLMNFIQANIKD